MAQRKDSNAVNLLEGHEFLKAVRLPPQMGEEAQLQGEPQEQTHMDQYLDEDDDFLEEEPVSRQRLECRRLRVPHHGMLGVPEQIGNYTILARIGQGGMANIYLARQWGLGGFARNVALKLLQDNRAQNLRYVRMFRDEAKLGALIDHPSVCRVLEFGEADGQHYIALEYLVGEPFSKLMNRSIQSPEWLKRPEYFALMGSMLARCCEGLHAAHQALDAQGRALNPVHRDVSPHNLFALYDGTVRVVDFGVARYDHREHATTVKILKGKVAYMSPEHILGDPLDRRSDVWSMGVVLWELLAGARLFRMDTEIDVMRAVIAREIVSPHECNRQAPEDLCAIALKALSRDPRERYQSAEAMADAISQAVNSSGFSTHASAVRSMMREMFPDGEEAKQELLARFKGVVSSGVFERARKSDTEIIPDEAPLKALLDEPLVHEPQGDEPTTALFVEPGPIPLTRKKHKSYLGWLALSAIPLLTLAAAAHQYFSPQGLSQLSWQEPPKNAQALPPFAPLRSGLASPDQVSAGSAVSQSNFFIEKYIPINGPNNTELSGSIGDLHLSTESGAPVPISRNGIALGSTPLRVRLPVGPHTLEAQFPDGRRVSLAAEVQPRALGILKLKEMPLP